MKYTRLGATGLEVSKLCFGCMSFGTPNEQRPWILREDEARPLLRASYEAGINFFDTANTYAGGTSEEIVGKVLAELAPREELVVATKVYNRMRPGANGAGLSRKAIMDEIDNSLRRLGMDYVDLYQIHRADPNTPFEETMEALHDVVKAGKARYIGASSMWAWQFAKYQYAAERNGWTRFVSMQNQVSLTYREEEREMLPLCAADGIGVMPWSPLGGGRLTRPWGQRTPRSTTDVYNKSMYDNETNGTKDVVEAVEKLSAQRGVPMAQIALAWVLAKPVVSAPIIGISRAGQLDDALAALDLALQPEDIAQIEAPYRPLKPSGF